MTERTCFLLMLTLAIGVSRDARAQGSSQSSQKLAVKGTVGLSVSMARGDITVLAGKPGEVRLRADKASKASLVLRGKRRVVVRFGGKRPPVGDLTLHVPPGSDVVANTVSGDIRVTGVEGDVNLRAVSGDVAVIEARRVEATLVSGDFEGTRLAGPVRIETVSGDASVESVSKPELIFETTSGDLRWRGRCQSGCRLEAHTLSGDLEFHLDPASSFEVAFDSFSGELVDRIGLQRGGYRSRAGAIDAETYSGTVTLSKQ